MRRKPTAGIAVLLDPQNLANPDADLRYLLPEALVAEAEELLVDDAYDYDERDRLILFLATCDAGAAVPLVISVLARVEVLGNRFGSAVVALADQPHGDDLEKYRVVHPAGLGVLAEV